MRISTHIKIVLEVNKSVDGCIFYTGCTVVLNGLWLVGTTIIVTTTAPLAADRHWSNAVAVVLYMYMHICAPATCYKAFVVRQTDNSVYLLILPCVSICCNVFFLNVYSHVDLIVHTWFCILQLIILHLDFIYVNVLCFIDIDHWCCILFDLSEMMK